MAILTLKNRWKDPFIGMWDGQTYEVVDTLACLDYIARHLKRQSIIRDNPINPGLNEYRLAIVEDGDDQSKLTFDSLPQESLDRSDMDEFRKVVIKPSGIRTPPPAPKLPASLETQIRTTD
jgi:hypothetical protein